MKDLVRLKLADVEPYYEQPRQEFNDESLAELAESMREHGQRDPVLVRVKTSPDTGKRSYELISGERRWRALQMIGATHIEALVDDEDVADDDRRFELAMVANAAREDLSPSDHARAVAKLAGMAKYQHPLKTERIRRLAATCGKSTTWVESMLKLDGVAPEVKQLVDKGQMTQGVALEVAAIPTPERQAEVAQRVSQAGMSTRSALGAVRQAVAVEKARSPNRGGRPPASDADLITSLVGKTLESAEQALDMPTERLAKAYAGARRPELSVIKDRVRSAIAALRQLHEALERLGKP